MDLPPHWQSHLLGRVSGRISVHAVLIMSVLFVSGIICLYPYRPLRPLPPLLRCHPPSHDCRVNHCRLVQDIVPCCRIPLDRLKLIVEVRRTRR